MREGEGDLRDLRDELLFAKESLRKAEKKLLIQLVGLFLVPSSHVLVVPDRLIRDRFGQPQYALLDSETLLHYREEILRSIPIDRVGLERGEAVSRFLDFLHGQKFWADGHLVTEPEFRLWNLEYEPLLDTFHFDFAVSFFQGNRES